MSQSSKFDKNLNTILGKDVKIQGDIIIKSGIMVYGKVNGNIISTGIVRTAHNSNITGNIVAQNAMISGVVEGNISASEKVVLSDKSSLTGNLKTKILVIESGALFDGVCDMSKKSDQKPERGTAVSQTDSENKIK